MLFRKSSLRRIHSRTNRRQFERLESRELLTVTASNIAPLIDDADIANLNTPGAFDPGGDQGHIWSNRPIQGQTFTTGSDPGGYSLKAVTLRDEENNINNNTAGFTVRVGTIAGNTFTQIASEAANNPVSYVTNDYMTFTFATPITLNPDTVYAFEWDAAGSGFTTWNNTDTAYAGGTGYSSGGGGVPNDGAIIYRNIDRVFHVDLESAGPTTELNVTNSSIVDNASFAIAPTTLTLDFNTDYDLATIAASDLVVNATTATSFTPVDSDTLEFTLPALGIGVHTLSIDNSAINGDGGLPFDGFGISLTVADVIAESISINFEGRTSGPSIQVAPGGIAGVVPTTDWNNIQGTTNVSGTFGPFSLTGSDGATAQLTWSATGTWSTTNTGNRNFAAFPTTDSDANMMDGHIEAAGSGETRATVTGLADDYSKYDVYVYVGDDAGNRNGEIYFNNSPTPLNFVSKIYDGTYTIGTDYFLFEDVSGDSFTVSVEPQNDDSANRTGIRGIQIIGNDTLRVVASDPADGALVVGSPTTVTLDFDQEIDAASVDPGDLKVNGLSALSVSMPDIDTLVFTLPPGLASGVNTLSIADGALMGVGGIEGSTFESTFTIVVLPTAINTPATDIEAVSATIGGQITDTGSDIPNVTIFWGSADGQTTPGNWENSQDLGLRNDLYSLPLTNLDPSTQIFYRSLVENIAGGVWTDVASFNTNAIVLPSVVATTASSVSSSAARIGGQVTDSGGQPPTVTLVYGDEDGGVTTEGWDVSINKGQQTGVFSSFITGLNPETTYYYRAVATNDAGEVWSAAESFTTSEFVEASIVINEIHFDPDSSNDLVEFIELYNAGSQAIDISGWQLSDAVRFTFAAGTTLAAGDYAIVAQTTPDPANPYVTTFEQKYGFAPLGNYTGKLSNSGERILLLDASLTVQDEVDYRLGFPWPTVGQAPGYSIELIHPSLDNDLAGSWRSSVGSAGGTLQTFVSSAQDWKYFKGTQEPPADWRESSFNDTLWLDGTAPIGYGDGHVQTVLTDMQGNYSTVYFRKSFNVDDPGLVTGLTLETQFDDGINVWINGFHVLGENNSGNNNPPFNATAETAGENLTFRSFALPNPTISDYLQPGNNVITVQLLNASISGSSDAWFDGRLLQTSGNGAGPTPGTENSIFAINAAPQMRQVKHSPQAPQSGQDVTITVKATDPDGVANVTLDYQLVDPGNYIRLTDAAYETNWTTVAMLDDGSGGDLIAGDDVYSVVLPAALQTNRRLVRYRITSQDTLGTSVTGPFADDPQPNFAYFVYDGVPDWQGSLQPGSPDVTYAGDVLSSIATYQLIADGGDVINSQYNGSFNLAQFRGTFVYDGKVYDHVEFRNRGRASTYQVGKNKWKINFARGHGFEARDNYGKKYDETWDKINILPGTNPWWRDNVSTEGTVLFEPVSFKLNELAGTPSPKTQFFQFRIIDNTVETNPADQYDGDFWGLYIGIEQPDRNFLNERGLPDGNIYNMHGTGGNQRTQGSLLPTDRSDMIEFVNGYNGNQTEQWYRENLNLESYFAWNAMNLAVNNSDLRPQENVNYYLNQETGQWYTIPWDMDLTFEDRRHLGRPPVNFDSIDDVFGQHPAIGQEYENYVRNLLDLLFDSGDAALVVDEFSRVLTLGNTTDDVVLANQALWDFNPRKNKKGIWYENFNPALLPSKDFAGLVTYMEDFLSPGGYGYNLLAGGVYPGVIDPLIPNKPILTYTGSVDFPVNDISLQSSPFSDPQGAATFGAMQWRVAEVRNPNTPGYDPSKRYIYEIEGTWQSDELTVFDNQVSIPPLELEVGSTYRARVRTKDDTGRWSRWSEAAEFTTTPALPTDVFNYLRISELNYHPAIDGDAEFIELTNISSGGEAVTLDLSGTAIDGGPSEPFIFSPGTTLAPGEYLLVVRDLAAFSIAYPDVDPGLIAGEYSGALSNGGERITVIDAEGGLVHDFRYEDGDDVGEEAWHVTTDGQGPTLAIVDLDAPREDWNTGAAWRPSVADGGSPGTDDELTGDFNQDGLVGLVDAALMQANLASGGAAANLTGDGQMTRSDIRTLLGLYGNFTVAASPAAPAALVSRAETGNLDAAFAGNSTGDLVAGVISRRSGTSRLSARRVVIGHQRLSRTAVDRAVAEESFGPTVRRPQGMLLRARRSGRPIAIGPDPSQYRV